MLPAPDSMPGKHRVGEAWGQGLSMRLPGQRAWVTCEVALMSALKRATPSGSNCAFSASAAMVSTCA